MHRDYRNAFLSKPKRSIILLSPPITSLVQVISVFSAALGHWPLLMSLLSLLSLVLTYESEWPLRSCHFSDVPPLCGFPWPSAFCPGLHLASPFPPALFTVHALPLFCSGPSDHISELSLFRAFALAVSSIWTPPAPRWQHGHSSHFIHFSENLNRFSFQRT